MEVSCKERIAKLETLLEKSSSEKDDMRDKILDLTREVAELRVKVEFLENIKKYPNIPIRKTYTKKN